MNRLLSNLGAILLSLLLAVVVWFIAIQSENPIITGDLDTQVPVNLIGPDPGMALVGQPLDKVTLTVQAARQIWEEPMRPEDFVVQADLRGLSAGRHDVPLIANHPGTEVRILAIRPDSLVVTLDDVAERTIPIQVEIIGEPAFGFEWRSTAVSPTEVLISGPASLVEQVRAANVAVALSGTRTSVERLQPITLRNENNQTVNLSKIEPGLVQVSVEVAQRPGYRDFSVRVPYTGTVASGYHITGIAVEPSLVTLRGSPSAFDQLPGYVETFPVNINEAAEDIATRVALNLPESVAAVGWQSVAVEVAIDPLMGSRNYEIEPVIRGLDREMTRTVPLPTVSVVVRGPLPVLDDLESGHIQMLLDLTGLQPGTHTVPVVPVLPEGVEIISLLPELVDITILSLATPTPTPPARALPAEER